MCAPGRINTPHQPRNPGPNATSNIIQCNRNADSNDTCTVGRGVGRYGLGDSGLSMGTGSRPSLPVHRCICTDVYVSICVCIYSGLSMGTVRVPLHLSIQNKCIYAHMHVYMHTFIYMYELHVCIHVFSVIGLESRTTFGQRPRRQAQPFCRNFSAGLSQLDVTIQVPAPLPRGSFPPHRRSGPLHTLHWSATLRPRRLRGHMGPSSGRADDLAHSICM